VLKVQYIFEQEKAELVANMREEARQLEVKLE